MVAKYQIRAAQKYRASVHGKRTIRAYDYKRRYGITIEEYEQLFQEQNGLCAICFTAKCRTGYRLSIDHDHVSNKVRGLLCKACNLIVGNAEDSIERLHSAINYLTKRKVG